MSEEQSALSVESLARPPRSTLAVLGFVLMSIASAMAFAAAEWLFSPANNAQLRCVGSYFSGTDSCSWMGVPRWASVPVVLSAPFGFAALWILLEARLQIRRSTTALRGIWLVRFGFVLAIAGTFIAGAWVIFLMSAAMYTSG